GAAAGRRGRRQGRRQGNARCADRRPGVAADELRGSRTAPFFPSPLVGEGGGGGGPGLSASAAPPHPSRTLSAPPSPTRGEGKRCVRDDSRRVRVVRFANLQSSARSVFAMAMTVELPAL